jgi:hypothetical protein
VFEDEAIACVMKVGIFCEEVLFESVEVQIFAAESGLGRVADKVVMDCPLFIGNSDVGLGNQDRMF